jgi:rhodanese-related sulfurtransferase
MKIITTEDLAKRVEAGDLAIFDVRGDLPFSREHLPGAKSAPLGSLTYRVGTVMNRDSQLVVYSQSRDCPLSAEAMQQLEGLGFTDVVRYVEGLDGWKEAGFEAEIPVRNRPQTEGEIVEVRPLVIDRAQAYGGVFSYSPTEECY